MDVLGFATLGFLTDGTGGTEPPVTPPPTSSTGGGFVGTVELYVHRLASAGGLRASGTGGWRPSQGPSGSRTTWGGSGGLVASGAGVLVARPTSRELEDLALLNLVRPS